MAKGKSIEGDGLSMEPTSGGPYGVNRAARRRGSGSVSGSGEGYGSESGLGGSRAIIRGREVVMGRPRRAR
jgi:hypothetical protein